MLLWITILLFLFAPTNDPAQIEQSLRQSYEKQTRLLRSYYSDSHLRYDATGALIGTAHPGPWALGYVAINSLKLNHGQLEIRGKRVGARIMDKPTQIAYLPAHQDVRIEIDCSPTPDESTLRGAIEHVFNPVDQIVVPALPDYWHDLLNGNVVYPATAGAPMPSSFRSGCPSGISTDVLPEVEASGTRRMVCAGRSIYRVGNGVRAPKALRTPDPKYTEGARQSKLQGTTVLWMVVDDTGHPQMIRIVRAIGMGLDDVAVETVRGWLFKPAEFEDHPVAVAINVEVNFRLY